MAYQGDLGFFCVQRKCGNAIHFLFDILQGLLVVRIRQDFRVIVFTGGIMPAEDLFLRYQRDLSVEQQWWINGQHYARTCEAWLDRLDRYEQQAKAVLGEANPEASAKVLVQRWRMFFMACAELFWFDDGNQWGVAHYLFDVNRSGVSQR